MKLQTIIIIMLGVLLILIVMGFIYLNNLKEYDNKDSPINYCGCILGPIILEGSDNSCNQSLCESSRGIWKKECAAPCKPNEQGRLITGCGACIYECDCSTE